MFPITISSRGFDSRKALVYFSCAFLFFTFIVVWYHVWLYNREVLRPDFCIWQKCIQVLLLFVFCENTAVDAEATAAAAACCCCRFAAAVCHRTPATRGVLHANNSTYCQSFYYERKCFSTPTYSTVACVRPRLVLILYLSWHLRA